MRPLGLSDYLARRHAQLIQDILAMQSFEEQNQYMGAYVQAAREGIKREKVSREHLREVGEVFAALKRSQFAVERGTIDF